MNNEEQLHAELRKYIPSDQATLRDQFAMAALHGIIVRDMNGQPDQIRQSEQAYEYADAMLKEREK
jgi:trehalose-6-phosphatase